MIRPFFHIATVTLEAQRTITANWYVTKYLPKIFDALRRERPKTGLRGILLHRDNASTHRTYKTTKFLSHVAYSPDLARFDFFFFFFRKRRIKFAVTDFSHLKLQWLHMKSSFATCLKMSGEQLIQNGLRGWNVAYSAMENALRTRKGNMFKDEWRTAYSKWFERMKRCIQCHGERFENT